MCIKIYIYIYIYMCVCLQVGDAAHELAGRLGGLEVAGLGSSQQIYMYKCIYIYIYIYT